MTTGWSPRARMNLAGRVALAALLLAVAACTSEPSPSATGVSGESVAPASTLPATSPPSTETPAATATPTPQPTLSLDPPGSVDPSQVAVTVQPAVAADGGGEITVTVISNADALIEELVLRWPTDLAHTLFLVPFVPDDALVREGGGNLIRQWTKWVIGPGEQGEPAGTTSLGYGPIEPGQTLTIPLFVTRVAPGPVSFDLQVLAGEQILTLPDGVPAEIRVEIP